MLDALMMFMSQVLCQDRPIMHETCLQAASRSYSM